MPHNSQTPLGIIDSLYYYPVKGLSPQPLDQVALGSGRGFPHDRRYALARRDGRYQPGARQALSKREFYMLMRDEKLAQVRSVFTPETEVLQLFENVPPLEHDGGASPGSDGPPLLTADLSTATGRSALTKHIGDLLGLPAEQPPVFAEEEGRRFPDLLRTGEREMQAVSIINLASVRELSDHAGVAVDPLRFRANIYLDGLPAFAERDLVGSTLHSGTAQLEVFQEIGRCAATEVNPATAQRDLPMLELLYKHFGHSNMGVYAHVTVGGTLAPGHALSQVRCSLNRVSSLKAN